MEKFHNASVFRGANISFLPNGGIIWFSTGISGLTPSLAKLGFPVGYLQARLQGGKTFCASFCASLIAGSRRAFLCVDCVSLLLEFWVTVVLSEVREVRTFAPCKAFLFDMFAFFSSLENYFGFRTTNVKGKTYHSVSLRWNKRFWTFLKRRVFFLIMHPINLWVDFAGLN